MIKISHILTGALAAAALLVADWATAAPLSLSHLAYSRADQMAPVEEQTDQGYVTPDKFKRQIVAYTGNEAPGTIIIDTPNTFLYLVQPGGRAIRYGIGVGRDGFRWQGVQHITKKAEWPDWNPPAEMIARQPYLPRFMAGGPTHTPGALHGRWPDHPAWRARHVSRQHDLSHPRHQRPVHDRHARVVRLHPPHERGRDRSRQPRERRHQGGRDQHRRSSGFGSDGFRPGEPAAAVNFTRSRSALGSHAGPGSPGPAFSISP